MAVYNISNLQDLKNRQIVTATGVFRADHSAMRSDEEQRIAALNDWAASRAGFQASASAPTFLTQGGIWADVYGTGKTRWFGNPDALAFDDEFATRLETKNFNFESGGSGATFKAEGVIDSESLSNGGSSATTYVLPANSLAENGQFVSAIWPFEITATGGVATKFSFAEQTVLINGPAIMQAVVKGMIFRTGASTGKGFAIFKAHKDSMGWAIAVMQNLSLIPSFSANNINMTFISGGTSTQQHLQIDISQ